MDTHNTLALNPFAVLPMFVPIFKHIPIVNSKFNAMMNNRNSLFEFIERQISEHEKLLINKKADDGITDFVYAFFNEMEQRNSKSANEQDHSFK